MWLYLIALCAFFTATTAVLFKLALRKHDQYISAWLGFALPGLIFAIALLRFHPKIHDPLFWLYLAALSLLELFSFLIYLEALRISAISLVFPFLALTPIFTISTSYILLKEKLVLPGIIGVCCISLGAYLLNAYTVKQGPMEPIRRIFKEKGVMLMIVAAFIYGIISALGKKAMLYVGPAAFPLIYVPILFLLFSATALYRLKKKLSHINMDVKSTFLFLSISVSFVFAAFLHYKAMSLANVSYVVSVKSISLLFAVLYGAIIFKEGHIKYRFAGALIMAAGAAIIAVFQGR